MNHYILKCPFCNKHQVRQIDSFHVVFKCKFCNKTRTIKKKTEVGLSIKLYGPYFCLDAAKMCSEMNKNNKV